MSSIPAGGQFEIGAEQVHMVMGQKEKVTSLDFYCFAPLRDARQARSIREEMEEDEYDRSAATGWPRCGARTAPRHTRVP
jgi:hypothetical protein